MTSVSDDSDLAIAPEFLHIPVLHREVIEGLAIRPDGHYLDVTVGGGGHTALILAATDGVRVTALDQDDQAIAAATQKLAEFGDRVTFQHSNFCQFQPRRNKV